MNLINVASGITQYQKLPNVSLVCCCLLMLVLMIIHAESLI